jgi:hypothetical protein
LNYLADFLERNKTKSFITNLEKYLNLSYFGKCKVVSSFLTHLCIDAETLQTRTQNDIEENTRLITEILSILNELILYKIDNFIEWITNELNRNVDS